MSLLKWTLALAGTAMTVRYLSDRHRQRLTGGSDRDRDPQIDRDDTYRGATGSSMQGTGAGSTGMGGASSSGLGRASALGDDSDTLSPGGGLKGTPSERF